MSKMGDKYIEQMNRESETTTYIPRVPSSTDLSEEIEKAKQEVKESFENRIRKENRGLVAGACFTIMIIIGIALYCYALVQKVGG
jgi:hypothetical protein